MGVAVDSSGNVYVTDRANNRVQKFDSSGVYITQWGSYGGGNGQFEEARSVTVDSSGNVYVADSGNDRVEKFGESGFTLSFDASGLLSDVDSSTVVLTVTIGNAPATSVTKAELPTSFSSIASGTTVSYSYNSPIASTTAGKQYRWLSTSGAGSVVIATYKTQYQLTISVSPSGSGTATPVPAGPWYDSGASVSMTAAPSSGYMFGSWLLDGSPAGSTNPITVTMNGPHTLVADFMTPAQATQKLINLKDSMNLLHGIANSLDAKLRAALDSINKSQNTAAMNQLSAFINEVNAQTGKDITTAQAAPLIAATNDIINALH